MVKGAQRCQAERRPWLLWRARPGSPLCASPFVMGSSGAESKWVQLSWSEWHCTKVTVNDKKAKNCSPQGTFPNLLYEDTIILIPKPDKDTIKKENYSSISLMNINEKYLNKILANQIQQHKKKKIILHDQLGFILASQEWFNTRNVIYPVDKR